MGIWQSRRGILVMNYQKLFHNQLSSKIHQSVGVFDLIDYALLAIGYINTPKKRL